MGVCPITGSTERTRVPPALNAHGAHGCGLGLIKKQDGVIKAGGVFTIFFLLILNLRCFISAEHIGFEIVPRDFLFSVHKIIILTHHPAPPNSQFPFCCEARPSAVRKALAYLYTIARNLCMDAFRKKQPVQLPDELPDRDSMERLELKIAVRQALKTLPEQERELLLLRYANELSVGEISVIMGMSRFAVYRRTSSALATLKVLLREEDSNE